MLWILWVSVEGSDSSCCWLWSSGCYERSFTRLGCYLQGRTAEQPPLVWWWRDGWLTFSKGLYFSGCFHRPKAGVGVCFGPVGQKRARWVSSLFLS